LTGKPPLFVFVLLLFVVVAVLVRFLVDNFANRVELVLQRLVLVFEFLNATFERAEVAYGTLPTENEGVTSYSTA